MDGHTLVPRNSPNPEGDRRFAERAFPLLEPLEWAGERHRGGYGVSEPGSVTNSLGLIFGPVDPFVSEPRLAITVGNDALAFPFIEHSAFMLRTYLVKDREALYARPLSTEPPPSFHASIEVEGERVAVEAYGSATDRWVGLSAWRGHSVFVHAIDIRPEHVQLRVTEQIH